MRRCLASQESINDPLTIMGGVGDGWHSKDTCAEGDERNEKGRDEHDHDWGVRCGG